jgi:[histone H3]-lysine9 N-trimethyltransferase SUV39H
MAQGITAEELEKCHHCQLLAFSNREEYPIHLKASRTPLEILRGKKEVNALPTNFTFIEESILREGVERAESEFRSGCECKDDEDCLREGCSCLQDMEYDEPREDGKIYAYNYDRYTGEELLRDEILDSRDPIYECHSGCGCSADCRNRVVERGRKIPLDLFRTTDGRGWGKPFPLVLL